MNAHNLKIANIKLARALKAFSEPVLPESNTKVSYTNAVRKFFTDSMRYMNQTISRLSS